MKYCVHCGAELLDDAVLCPKCGCPVGSNNAVGSGQEHARPRWDACAITGFVLSMVSLLIDFFTFVSIPAGIVSLVGVVRTNNKKTQGMGLAIAGLCVSVLTTLFSALLWALVFNVIANGGL